MVSFATFGQQWVTVEQGDGSKARMRSVWGVDATCGLEMTCERVQCIVSARVQVVRKESFARMCMGVPSLLQVGH